MKHDYDRHLKSLSRIFAKTSDFELIFDLFFPRLGNFLKLLIFNLK